MDTGILGPPHAIRAVIFDVDGTLIDSVDLNAKAWQDAFLEIGHDVEFEKMRRQIGKGGDQLMPLFLTNAELNTQCKKLEQRRGVIFKQRYLSQAKAFPMVRELLQRIQADGMQAALASSAKQDELETYKRIAHIDDLLQAETTSDDAKASKPHPDIFEAALQRLGSPGAEQVIVVGDTPYDAEAAVKAGLRPIGLLCGGWPAADLKDAGCIATYDDPAHLLAQYAASPLAPLPVPSG